MFENAFRIENELLLFENYFDLKAISEVYKDITAYFYEKDGDTISVISSSPKKDNITLDDYLSNLSFKVDHYSKTCKMYSTSDMYIELDISTNDGIGIVYKVPLELEDNCN